MIAFEEENSVDCIGLLEDPVAVVDAAAAAAVAEVDDVAVDVVDAAAVAGIDLPEDQLVVLEQRLAIVPVPVEAIPIEPVLPSQQCRGYPKQAELSPEKQEGYRYYYRTDYNSPNREEYQLG